MAAYKFSAGVLKEASQISLNDKHLKSLGVYEGITIDDASSKDLDDGFQLETDSDGWILYVSIADVASYVKKDSHIFEAAKNLNCTSYLPGNKIPMLPAELSENKLSLLEKKLRPALTFKITLSSEIEILDFEVQKTAFKSRRQLSYQLTDEILARERQDKEFGHLAECYHLANLLLEKRRERGALVIYDFIKGVYTNEEGRIIINKSNRLHMANIIVQEFMILTNSAAAEFFIKKNKQILLRNHTAKSTTPPRDEIYSQYILAKNNPNTIENLKKRIELWFERAEYSTKLKGHYGLNLPAYTHVTSPLRRFPDLINQYIIHSFISGRRTPFSKDSLNKLALRINRNFQKIQDSKIKHHKEKAIKELLEIAESETPGAFDNLDNRKFKSIIYQSCINNNISNKLAEEIEKRILSGDIGAEHLVYLLFELKKDNKYYDKFLELSFRFLKNHPGTSSALINIAQQKKYLQDIQRESKQLSEGFAEIISVKLKGEMYSSPETQIKNSKKDAANYESLNFLENYFANKLAPLPEIKFTDNKSQNHEKKKTDKLKSVKEIKLPENKEPSENYAGKLYELCMKHKIFSYPEFIFNQTGQTNNATFNCICKVECEGLLYETVSSSRKKSSAKHLAAREMKEKLEEYLKNLNRTVQPSAETVFISENRKINTTEENYVGIIENLSVKYSDFFKTEYDFSEEITPENKFRHTCTCKITVNSNTYTVKDTQNSKKEAKQQASKKIIDILIKKSILARNSNGEYEIKGALKKSEPSLNYSGMLYNIILVHNNFSEPEYEFSISGTPNKPEITFRCRLTADNREFITEFTSSKKSISKQKSSFLMIKKLLGLYAEKIPENRKFKDFAMLYDSEIKELIENKNIISFRYTLFKWFSIKSELFSCVSELQSNDNITEIITTDSTIEKTISKSVNILKEFLTSDNSLN